MPVVKTDELPIQVPSDIVLVRQAVRAASAAMGFSLVDQTKIVTATSELARNTLDYGGGGLVRLVQIEENPTEGPAFDLRR